MKLIKFRILNYKSIKDSGWCWIASDLTILAGKNESGKSAILEALRDFDSKKVPDSAFPLEGDGKPSIELCFKTDSKTFETIEKNAHIKLIQELKEEILRDGLTIINNFDGRKTLDEAFSKKVNSDINIEESKYSISDVRELIDNIIIQPQFTGIQIPNLESVSNIEGIVKQLITQFNSRIGTIQNQEIKQECIAHINDLSKIINNFPNGSLILSERLAIEFYRYTPHLTFFSDFIDILPFEIPFNEIDKHETVKDFASVANLNLEEVIKATDSQRRRNLLSTHSAKISGEFIGYWVQNKIELVAESDGEKLRFGIKESDKTILFKTEQRSKGFQWFLSFYLRLNTKKDESNIILIDEPGLYLHAKAQKDVLKVLENISKESQIIFSTHSPYLINPNRLDRIRLALKDMNGSRIESKIHKDADIETLTPIITAIGLDIQSNFSIAKDKM